MVGVSTAIGGLIAESLPQEPDTLTQLSEWITQVPVLSWGLAIFTLISIAAAAIAKLTGNLDKIFSFIGKYLPWKKAELSESQLENIRQLLLEQMGTNVAQRLRDSLHKLVAIDLEQQEQLHQVGRQRLAPLAVAERQSQPFHNLIQRSLKIFKNRSEAEPVAPGEKTYSVFCRSDIGRRLLILGEPGAGKTTELLTVAERLVSEAVNDSEQPVPLLFELSNWKPNTSVSSWLGEQLHQSYGVSKKLVAPLVVKWLEKQSRVLLLLDGLDELGTANQLACIEALEDFLETHPGLPVIVCCRRQEYEKSGKQIRQLNGAIYLQAASTHQIKQYLNDLGQNKLWERIQVNPKLLELAKLPLFLTMFVIAYQGQPIQDTKSLFDAYIQKQLYDPNYQGSYKWGKKKSPEQTLHYLSWLAKQMKRRNRTEFLIEDLQPDCLASEQQKRIYKLAIRLTIVVLFGLVSSLSLGLTSGGLSVLVIVLTVWLSLCVVRSRLDEIVPHYITKQSSNRVIGGLLLGLFAGLVLKSAVGLFFGLLIAEFTRQNYSLYKSKQVPNQSIKISFQNGVIRSLFVVSICLFIGELEYTAMNGLSVGLLLGLYFGLISGLLAVIQHGILRLLLTANGNMPWNYALFLEYATRHRFIQRIGGRYRFFHDLLRKHFVRITPQQQQAILSRNSNFY